MRNLAQPQVLKFAAAAALATAALCYPKLSYWQNRTLPLWYLEAVLFSGSIVLWAFVFAWHEKYANRPVFTLKVELKPFIAATLAGIFFAAMLRVFVDPAIHRNSPVDYPDTLEQWIAMVLFNLSFSQLFLVFAPFAWLLRLFHNRWTAAGLTVLFGVAVLVLKSRSAATPVPLSLFATLLISRIFMGFASLYCYLRGGLLLAYWWSLLFEARHLWNLGGQS